MKKEGLRALCSAPNYKKAIRMTEILNPISFPSPLEIWKMMAQDIKIIREYDR